MSEASPSPPRIAGIYSTRLRPSVETIVAGAEQHPQQEGHGSPGAELRRLKLYFAEKIRQLEVRLAISQRCESDSKRQLLQARSELMEVEKRVASKEVANVRRDQSIDALHAMLQEERQRSADNADATNKVRALLHGERLAHALTMEQQQHHVDALEREVAKLRQAGDATAHALQAQTEANALLMSERHEAERWYRGLRNEDNCILHDAMEQHALACRLQAIAAAASQQMNAASSGDGDACIDGGADSRMSIEPSSVKHAGHGSSEVLQLQDALADARGEVERLLLVTQKQEKMLMEFRQRDVEHLAERQLSQEALASAKQQAHADASTIASHRYELDDMKAMAALLEHRLGDEQLRSAQLQDALSCREYVQRSRQSSTQTTIDAKQVCAWEADSAMLLDARSALATERIIWSGRTRAAEVRADAATRAMEAVRKDIIHTSLLPDGHKALQDAQREAASLRDELALQQVAIKKQSKTIELQTLELETANARLQRMQSLMDATASSSTAGTAGTHSNAQTASEVHGQPFSPSLLLPNQQQQQQQDAAAAVAAVLQAKCDALQRSMDLSHTESSSLREDVANLQVALADATGRLQEAQSRNVRMVEQLEDATMAAHRDAAIREAQSRNADISAETVDAIRATAQHNELVLRDVAVMLHKHNNDVVLASSPEHQQHAPSASLEDLTFAARAICATLTAERDKRIAWQHAAAWLVGRHAAVVRWLAAPPVQALMASQHTLEASLNAGGPDESHGSATTTPSRPSAAACVTPSLIGAGQHTVDATLNEMFAAACNGALVDAMDVATPMRLDGSTTASPYTGEAVAHEHASAASPPRRTSGSGGSHSPTPRGVAVMPAVTASAMAVDAMLEQVLCALQAQQLDVSHLRKSMYDVKTAFLAEMEAREALEAELATMARKPHAGGDGDDADIAL